MDRKDEQEAPEIRRKRLRYRAWHRGTLEMDEILGHFADARLGEAQAELLARFEALLELADADLYAWLIGQTPIPPGADADLLRDIASFQEQRVKP